MPRPYGFVHNGTARAGTQARPYASASPNTTVPPEERDGEFIGSEPLRDVRRFSHEAMASVFEVHAVHPDQLYASQAAHAAFDLVDRLEGELSRFLPNSDIARVNRLAPGASTRVSPSTMECLVIARHVFDLTGGAFDVSIGTGLRSLGLDVDDFLVRATKGGVRIDLGGIGKGYAVDRMADLLEEWGIESALVHGGFSSVLALGAPPGRDGWPLTLSEPGASRVLGRLSVRQTALGASGLRKGDHIVDPRTGKPVRGRRAAWVAVPRPEGIRGRGAGRGGAADLGRRSDRRPDDGLHAAGRRRRSRRCARRVPGSRPGSSRPPRTNRHATRACCTSVGRRRRPRTHSRRCCSPVVLQAAGAFAPAGSLRFGDPRAAACRPTLSSLVPRPSAVP